MSIVQRMVGRVVRISVAPVKALGLVHPEEVELGPDGVVGDRRFWMVEEDGRLFNNKRHGPMVRTRVSWDEQTRALELVLPDGTAVSGTVELGERVDAVMYDEPHPSRVVLGPWAEAISAYVGRPISLLWGEGHAKDRGYMGGTVSLVSRGSLARLAEEGGVEAVDGRRFRMLFEVDGVAAHGEDEWMDREVQLGEAAVVRINGDVGRCAVTTHDPDHGIRDLDTLELLARYRPEGRTERLPLGVYGSVVQPGRVAVGDTVRPLPTG